MAQWIPIPIPIRGSVEVGAPVKGGDIVYHRGGEKVFHQHGDKEPDLEPDLEPARRCFRGRYERTGGTQEACGSSDAGTAFSRLCFSR